MGQAKNKQLAAFAPKLIEEWEATDCVNFAVGLAQVTGWLLHVDWWSKSTEHKEGISVEELSPLRVYVADNHDRIFDVRGTKSIVEFNERIIFNLVKKSGLGNGCVYTRYYDEAKLSSLPLRSQPDESMIAHAVSEIRANRYFLGVIPVRKSPCIPSHHAAPFTYGRCAAFAEAMLELTGLQPFAILGLRFSRHFEGTQRGKRGYFHSVVVHPDGMAEDAWGKASLADIAWRFGAIEFTISSEEHQLVVERIRGASAEIYTDALEEARHLIKLHRLT